MSKKWTKRQDRYLLMGLGTYGYAWLQKKTGGRTKKAVLRRAAKLYDSGVTRGAYTLNKLATSTGYSKSQLLRAQSALKQKWKRTSPRGAYLITEEQVDDIVNWLRHDFWSKSKRRYCCIVCNTEKRTSYAIGLCRRCYDKYRLDCKKRGIPTSTNDVYSLILSILRGDISPKYAMVVRNIRDRVKKRLALSMEQRDWLEMLKP